MAKDFNVYQEKPVEAQTTRQLSCWLTEVHLDARILSQAECEAHGVESVLDENGVQQELWTATDAFYRHAKPLSESDYAPLVSCIIRSRYSADDIEALVQNYLADKEKHASEWDDLQRFRQQAKQAARLAITQEEENK